MSDRVLALDIATTTGWAAPSARNEDIPVFGHVTVDPDGGRAQGRAYHRFRREVCWLISVYRPNVVAYEAPLPERREDGRVIHGFSTAAFLLGLCAIAEEAAFACGQLEVWACDIGSIRLHFCGNGRPQKADVMLRCKALGWSPSTFDESDAGAVWDFTRSTLRAGKVMADREVQAGRQWGTR